MGFLFFSKRLIPFSPVVIKTLHFSSFIIIVPAFSISDLLLIEIPESSSASMVLGVTKSTSIYQDLLNHGQKEALDLMLLRMKLICGMAIRENRLLRLIQFSLP